MKNKMLLSFLEEERGSTERINQEDAFSLLEITKGCRPSMHEPDEQGISVKVEGKYFDNAGTNGELCLRIFNEGGDTTMTEAVFNMANLVAFARIGAEAYLNSHRTER